MENKLEMLLKKNKKIAEQKMWEYSGWFRDSFYVRYKGIFQTAIRDFEKTDCMDSVLEAMGIGLQEGGNGPSNIHYILETARSCYKAGGCGYVKWAMGAVRHDNVRCYEELFRQKLDKETSFWDYREMKKRFE